MSTTEGNAHFLSKWALLRRHIALPQDHGSWVFLLSPLLIGLFAGGSINTATLALTAAALGAFLMRQPAMIAVKVVSGRRSRADLPAAMFWLSLYAIITAVALLGLILSGYDALMLLALPGIAVFAWHLFLVSKRSERRQAGVEILGAGALSLAAPAAYWVGIGRYDPLGWALWALTWLQSAASIVYAYLRLEQRELAYEPDRITKWRMGLRAALYTSVGLTVALAGSAAGLLPQFIWLPFFVQWGETAWGIGHPALRVKPTQIGVRQLLVSTIFTILFIITWRL